MFIKFNHKRLSSLEHFQKYSSLLVLALSCWNRTHLPIVPYSHTNCLHSLALRVSFLLPCWTLHPLLYQLFYISYLNQLPWTWCFDCTNEIVQFLYESRTFSSFHSYQYSSFLGKGSRCTCSLWLMRLWYSVKI